MVPSLAYLFWGRGIKPWTTNWLAQTLLKLIQNDSLASTLTGGEPPRKRNRRMPCPCIACDGKERDHRTIQSHLTLTNSLQENENPTTTTSHPQFHPNASNFQEDTPQSTDAHTADTPSSAVPTGMTNERIVTFTMKELSLKLQYGHSVAEFEHHLQNAADLIGENLFTKWAEVLKASTQTGVYQSQTLQSVCWY